MISKAIQIFDLHPTSDAWAIAADWIEDEGGDWVRAESIRNGRYIPDGYFTDLCFGMVDGYARDWMYNPDGRYSEMWPIREDDRFLVTNEGDTQSLIVYGEEWLLSHKINQSFI